MGDLDPSIVKHHIIFSCSYTEIPRHIFQEFQEFHDIFSWSYTEISGLDPSIVKHQIDTWPNVAPIHQKKRPIHPSKATVVKSKIEKLRTIDFIYPIAYTTWVSNLVPMNKK